MNFSRQLAIVVSIVTLVAGALSGQTAYAAANTDASVAASQPVLKAEILENGAVWLNSTTSPSLRIADYRISDASGSAIELSTLIASTAKDVILIPARPLDPKRVYFLEIPSLESRTRISFDGWFRTLYSAKPLGAEISPDGSKTDFRVFAPRAHAIRLYTYGTETKPSPKALKQYELQRDADGVWEVSLDGDLHGTWYDFTVHGPTDPGNFFYETTPVHASDPYARVALDGQSQTRVWRKQKPAKPLVNGRPKMEDVVAYEVHVQDFTDLLPVADDLKGTLPAMTIPGLKNKRGEPVGFDYLVNLGINVVHLLPMQEYFHYSDEEWSAAFKNDPLMKAMASSTENYDWGYRTTHAFAIENRFRRKGSEPGSEREQFANLVNAFHSKGIAVIVDIVPNHTGEDMDSRNNFLNFNILDRQYYYRTNSDGNHIGVFGNEVKTEDRPMVQRWLIDQAKALIEEFGVDGFRIDLAGQIDQQTLRKLREAVGEDIIIYGEPWIDVSDPVVRANPDWDWYKEDAPITFFQDDTRNAIIGSPFRLKDKKTDRGWAGGNVAQRSEVMRAIDNTYAEEAKSPNQGINYIDIHDNWTLADRFALTDWDGRLGVDQARYKIAAGLLLTSLGPIVLHGGSEFMRSKGLAPIEHRVLATATGPIYYKGREDTYNIRAPNQFDWDLIGKTASNDNPNDHRNMQAWWRGMIELRTSELGRVFRQGNVPPKDYVTFFAPENQALLGYLVGERIFVAANVGETAGTLDQVTLPSGRWKQVANIKEVNIERGVGGANTTLIGGKPLSIPLGATDFRIWVRQKDH